MEEDYHLDDRYTTGIWHNTHDGDFAKIQESEDRELVELVNPETDSVYWDMPVSEWVESEQHDFTPVSDEAVTDPTATVNRAIRMLQRNDINELAEMPESFKTDLKYAREQVSISAN